MANSPYDGYYDDEWDGGEDDPYYAEGSGSGDPLWYLHNASNDPYQQNGQVTFGASGVGVGTDDYGGLPGYGPIPRPNRTPSGDPGLVSSGGSPTPSSSPSQNTQNTTNNNYSLNSTAVGAESLSNALPPIAQGSPAGNEMQFDSQYIPQSQRKMSPAGMDSGSRMPGTAPLSAPSMSDYDPGLSKSGNGIPSGNPQPIATQGSQPSGMNSSMGGRALNALAGLTGVNRYRKMIQDVRHRPGQIPTNPNNPYGI